MGLDTDSICAALLHDCIEDTEFGYKEIENKFGTPVAELVDGVTRLGMLRYSKEQEQFEDLRKMFLAMAKDIRVILIKLADRLHNARTFQFLPERKQRDKALETMEIYAPIAHRLGMSRIKWELEDLSLKVLDPIGYNEIVEGLKAQSEQHEEFLQGIQDRISTKLKEANIHNAISARVKHIYSIYRKMYASTRPSTEIYDNLRRARHCRYRGGLLQRARLRPRPVQADSGPLQGLYLHAEAERLSVAAYDGHRPSGHPV